jgi:hypothetical protein
LTLPPAVIAPRSVLRLFPFALALPLVELFRIGDEVYDRWSVGPVIAIRRHGYLQAFGQPQQQLDTACRSPLGTASMRIESQSSGTPP